MIASVSTLLHDLRSHPLALALVVINALFAASLIYTLQQISASSARRDAIITQLIASNKADRCLQ